MTNDIPLMRAMFLLGAAYAAKAVREAMSDDNMADLFPVSAVAEAASEMMAGVKPQDGSSKFDVLMRRMGVPVGNGSAVMRLIQAMRTEAEDKELMSLVRQYRIANKTAHLSKSAAVVSQLRESIEQRVMLPKNKQNVASGVDVPVEF